MIYLFLGIITGSILGYKINDLIRKLNAGIELNLFDYDLYIGRTKKADVVVIDEKAKKLNLDKFNKRSV